MPVNAVEIVLITLILFFTSQFLISYFRFLTNSNNYNKFVINYLSNNADFCINYAYLYHSSLYCPMSQEYNSYISAIGKEVYVQYGSLVNVLTFNNNPFFIPIFGVKQNSFFIVYSNTSNISRIFVS
ncbi:MAG: hypothetical protein ACP5GJ_01235 [Nanopusillaceae archaeon]